MPRLTTAADSSSGMSTWRGIVRPDLASIDELSRPHSPTPSTTTKLHSTPIRAREHCESDDGRSGGRRSVNRADSAFSAALLSALLSTLLGALVVTHVGRALLLATRLALDSLVALAVSDLLALGLAVAIVRVLLLLRILRVATCLLHHGLHTGVEPATANDPRMAGPVPAQKVTLGPFGSVRPLSTEPSYRCAHIALPGIGGIHGGVVSL